MSCLATCSDVIRFWDLGGGGGGGLQLRKTTNVAAGATNSCCWNHNGQVVATAGDNGCITVLKLSGSIVPAGVLSAHERPIRGIAFSSKSRKLAAGGDAGVVEVWDLKHNNSRVTMRGHRGSVTCVSFFDRDSCVAAGDERGKVVLHRVAEAPSDDKGAATLPPAGGYASVTGLSMASAAAGPAVLGVSYADGAVRLWDTGSRACVREIMEQHCGAAAGIVFHPHNSSLFATVGHDGIVRCSDVRIGGNGGGHHKDGVLKSIQTDAPLTCTSFHHEGLVLAAGASDGTVRLVDLRTGREVVGARGGTPPKKAYAGPTPPSGGVRALAFQKQPSTRSSTSGRTTPASSGSGGSGGGFSNNGTATGVKVSSGSSRPRPPAATAVATSSPWDTIAAAAVPAVGGGNSGRPGLVLDSASDGGGVGGDGGGVYDGGSGGRGRGHDEEPGGRRTSSNRAGLQGTATAAAVVGLVETTPLFPARVSADSTQRQDYQQLTAEHSNSRSNGEHYAPAAAAGAAGGEGMGRAFDSSEAAREPVFRQRCQERHVFPRAAAAAGEAGGGRDHFRVATPLREQLGEASYRWRDDEPRGVNGSMAVQTPPPRTEGYGDSAGAAAAVARRSPAPPLPPPLARRRPDSSSPERVAAGLERRRRENGANSGRSADSGSAGGSGAVMATVEGDEWEVPRRAAFDNDNGNNSLGYEKDAVVPSTPDSGRTRVNAAGGESGRSGGGGGDSNGEGDELGSPSRTPRKRTMHPGGHSMGAGAGARAGTAASATAVSDEAALVGRQPNGAAGAAVGGARVVSLERSVLEQVLSSHVSSLREELRQELRNLHVDMLRQFHSLQDEQASSLSGFEERLGGLVAENQALRAENDRLRRVY